MKLPAIKDEIMLRDTDGEMFAINLEDGEIYQLNETAVKIFNFCQQEITLDEAVTCLAAECAVPGQEDVIREDVQETVQVFRELGFLMNES